MRLLIVWFVAFVAISAVLTMFPLAFIRAFTASTRVPATTYAFAAAASLGIYSLAASTAKRRGARLVLRSGFVVRAIATAILAVPFAAGMGGEPLALGGFAILVVAWPLLGVSGTALAAELAPGEKGEALGFFNACSSLAGAVGAFLGGSVMAIAGYGTVCMMAAILVALATACSGLGNVRSGQSAKAE